MNKPASPTIERFTEFRYLRGTVYVLENSKAERVKIGMTINNAVDRLGAVNDMWLGRKVTCQICGGRLLRVGELVPPHVKNSARCRGGRALPLEKDVSLAESYQRYLKNLLCERSGSDKGSITKQIKTLEKRIGLYQRYKEKEGAWQLSTTYYTECAEQVELLSHEILAMQLDSEAPFGEVFCCSVAEATEAVEAALSQLGLINSVWKKNQF